MSLQSSAQVMKEQHTYVTAASISVNFFFFFSDDYAESTLNYEGLYSYVRLSVRQRHNQVFF